MEEECCQHAQINIVFLPCTGAMCEAEETEFLDIEEGQQGEDVMTFICPACHQKHKSTVYRKR